MPRRISAKARFAKLARANTSPSNLPRGPYAGFNGGGYGGAYGGRWVNPLLPGARKDWLGAAGDLWRNSVVAACLGWLTDNFTDAILGTYGKGTPGKPPEPSPFPALEDLIGPAGTPNPWYTTDELWAASVLSYKTDGNAYWIIVPGSGGAGEPVELWWEPHFTVTPWRAVGSPNLVDKYYLWRPEGNVELDPSQVVHFRDGIDPRDPTRGMSRLKHTARNIVGLNDAETYTASIIGNLGALGVVWMPEGGPGDMADVDEKDALRVAQRLRQQMSRENAGKIGAINLPGKFERIGLGPQEMSLESILDRPEATVCAVLGVSAQSIGLAVGNNTRTFTNLKESDKLSWKNGLIPAQNRMARQLTHQLLPRFFDVPEGLHLGWDRSQVEALQQDLAEAATAATTLAGGAILTPDEARARFFKMGPLANKEGASIAGPQPEPEPADQGDGNAGAEGKKGRPFAGKSFNPSQSRDDHGRFAAGAAGNFDRAEARRRSRRRKHRARLKSRKYADRHESADVRELRASHVVERVEAADSIRTDRAERHEQHRQERRELVKGQKREARLLPEKHERQREKLAEIQDQSNATGSQSPAAQYNRLDRHANQEIDLAARHAAELRDQPREHLRARNALRRKQAAERRSGNEEHFRQALTYHTGQRKEEARVHRDERSNRQQDDE